MIIVNGKNVCWQAGLTVEKLLEQMNYTFPGIVVRVNGKVIEKDKWSSFTIENQANVHLHHLIAGG